MSTRSFIAVENEDGSCDYVYCHSDGYPEWNGRLLLENYDSEEAARNIISLGDLSCLCEKLYPDPTKPHSFDYDQRQDDVTVAYARDGGENLRISNAPDIMSLVDDFARSWCEYIYIYVGGEWYYQGREGKLRLLRDYMEEHNIEITPRNSIEDIPSDALDKVLVGG